MEGDDEVATVNEFSDLVDKGRLKGKSKSALHQTAARHFTKFLQHTRSQYNSLDDIPAEDIKDEMLGLFSDFLSKHAPTIKKFNTHDNYVSAIHVMVAMKYPDKRQSFQSYYKTLRDNIFKEFKAKEKATGVPFSKNAKPMRRNELEYICKTLFKECKLELRGVFSMDWVGVGRISEVHSLLYCVFFIQSTIIKSQCTPVHIVSME